MARRTHEFQTIRSEGGLLPHDLLRRLLDPRERPEGMRPEDYRLEPDVRWNEAVSQSWNRLSRHWKEFRAAVRQLPADEPATGLTNEKWTLPLLRELQFGLLPTTAGPEVAGRVYAINRFFGPVPIHLVGCGLSLDRRAAGVRGAAAANPHGLVQEFINRSPGHLWALVSNGLRLRILRDSQALSRQSFLEFDLEAMFSGEVFSDFVLFWLLTHATRFTPREGSRPETCWLERWTRLAEEQGTRALGDLRGGVERALQILGEGFASHPQNLALRQALRSGQLPPAAFHGQLLRLIYRWIFLCVAEDRLLEGQPLLHPPDPSEAARMARKRYSDHYSLARLREMAARIKGSRHGDLWQQLQLTMRALSGQADDKRLRERLALPALGSRLWDPASTADLNEAQLSNYDLLEALRHLAFTRQEKILRPVDYKNLGAEELGGVYESLLGLTPQIGADGARFTFAEFAGNERKTSGSYYTPDCLVQSLLDSALDPVVEQAVRGKKAAEAEKALLALKVCDPAVGSGHFLVGAAHRLARHLARVRALDQGEGEPSPLLYRQALRDVIGHCLYGVDLNPMAAELCRVSLWLEALEPGKPLTFLDHHIRVGNSLLGATPELLSAGIPDEAFQPLEGDEKGYVASLRKKNRIERTGQQGLFGASYEVAMENLALYGAGPQDFQEWERTGDDTWQEVREKEARYCSHVASDGYRQARRIADAWCSAFVWKKSKIAPDGQPLPLPMTQEVFRKLRQDPALVPQSVRDEIERLAGQYRFFHWHLEFPQVFAPEGTEDDGAGHGFDVVLGNPPWERVKLQEKEFFAERSPEIANAPNAAARKRLIAALLTENPTLSGEFKEATRQAEGESHFLRNGNRYPLCGRGDINLYAVFAEASRRLLAPSGRMGMVLPSGIASDDTTKFFFQEVVGSGSLINLFDFENRNIFPSVHSSYKFCLFTSGSGKAIPAGRRDGDCAEFVFFAHSTDDLRDAERRFSLSPEDIALLNPNTRTCPIFRSRRDAELTKAIYRRVPVLIREAQNDRPEENPWGIKFSTMFHMSNDSHLFRTRNQLEAEGCRLEGNIFRRKDQKANGEWEIQEYLPLYEAKMIHHFDHRWGTYEPNGDTRNVTMFEKQQPGFAILPRYWVLESDVQAALAHSNWPHRWFLGFRDIARTTDERTVIASIIANAAVGNNLPVILLRIHEMAKIGFIAGSLISIVCDFTARFKVGGTHLNFFILQQIPVPSINTSSQKCEWFDTQTISNFIMPRVIELLFSSSDMEPFARDCGWQGPPFRWDEERRFLLRCELDAAFFHLYLPAETDGEWRRAQRKDGCSFDETPEQLAELKKYFPAPRDAAAYILETFPIVRRKDEQKYGEFRTRRVILEIYDAMQVAIRTGLPYRTRLDPPPADPACCHPPQPNPNGK